LGILPNFEKKMFVPDHDSGPGRAYELPGMDTELLDYHE
jgi:hypothetical protein